MLFGIATAGANLGWNLAHNDFASLGRVQHYMGVNVTLTGMRGLIAPPLGAIVYTLLERHSPGAGRYALLLPLGLTLAGAIGFNRMKLARTGSRPHMTKSRNTRTHSSLVVDGVKNAPARAMLRAVGFTDADFQAAGRHRLHLGEGHARATCTSTSWRARPRPAPMPPAARA